MPPLEPTQGQRGQACSTEPDYAQWPTSEGTTVELPLKPGRVNLPPYTHAL